MRVNVYTYVHTYIHTYIDMCIHVRNIYIYLQMMRLQNVLATFGLHTSIVLNRFILECLYSFSIEFYTYL